MPAMPGVCEASVYKGIYEDCASKSASMQMVYMKPMPAMPGVCEASVYRAKGAVTSMGRLCLLLATATMDAAGLHLTGGTHSVAKHAVDGLK
eukprot:1159776-Pelagomonas_calceolata.AAC.5